MFNLSAFGQKKKTEIEFNNSVDLKTFAQTG